jgi:hypothetical protein
VIGVAVRVHSRTCDDLGVAHVSPPRCGDDPESLASYLRIEERKLEAGGLN